MFSSVLEAPDFKAVSASLVAAIVEGTYAAADAAGKVYEDGYRAAVPVHNPPGTFKSAKEGRQHFVNLINAVSRRTLRFQDKTGAYSVVGVKAAPGNWRPLAPQGLWIEEGTDDRYTKDGRYTGFVHAYHLLRQVAANYAVPATNTFNSVLKREIEK